LIKKKASPKSGQCFRSSVGIPIIAFINFYLFVFSESHGVQKDPVNKTSLASSEGGKKILFTVPS
jgi:hypothetical protein